MINLFKQNEGFSASTFKGLVRNGVEKIPKTLDGKLLQVDEQTYQYLKDHKLMWQNGNLVDNPNYADFVKKEEAKYLRASYVVELNGIKKWFTDNDWKINKIVIGEWTQEDPRWLEYLQERAIKRARQDELNTLLQKE